MNMSWLVLGLAIAISWAGQTLLKAGAMMPTVISQMMDLRTIFGLVSYGVATIFYIIALRSIAMSVAMPCTAISYVAVCLIGHYQFGERLGIRQFGALGLICAGVTLLVLA